MGQELVPRIHSMAMVNSIYIFCGNQTAHKQWITKWPKIKGVYNHIQPICEALRSSVKQCNQDAIPVSFVVSDDMSSTTDLNQLEPSFMYTQLFKNTLIDMEHNEQSRQDLINYCRRKYAGNLCELTIIDEFERSYCSNKAIWWYTRECFTYQMLNLALRLLEADIIVNMGFFIHDLHRQIEQLHQEQIGQYRDQPFIVYRGQGLSTIYFEKLKNAQGGLISFNNFLSTSKERLVSLSFAQGSSKKTDMVGILFVITVDPTISSTPFADIQSASYFQTEAEILFSMHSIFRINQLKRIDESSQLFELGFIYQRTSKIKIALDSQAFVAARAKYFQTLEELRAANVHLYYHDETWINLREVKRSIWTLNGEGEIKKGGGRGSRLAVSALIDVSGYHIPSVDIWTCTEDHNMDSTHFITWLDSTCATLREEIGKIERITICLDNATWHNKLTNESVIPKRASPKGEIQQCCQSSCVRIVHLKNISDQMGKKYGIEIFRLSKLHCSLNCIELSWNNLKQFVRDQNTTFRQDDAKQLIEQFMVAMDDKRATSYFHHVGKIKEMYKTTDTIMEEDVEPYFQSASEETDSDDE
ncbi:unnamed protein product [Adineta ricciae]|uniref:Uncharacterized protein n=1 Tax=Adineta ricciae TaxID=249248 RepID=A0A815D5I1_ADIRI|nr:unnamed protein product [Adineta ricciae]